MGPAKVPIANRGVERWCAPPRTADAYFWMVVTTKLSQVPMEPWPNKRAFPLSAGLPEPTGIDTLRSGASGCWYGNASIRLKSPWAIENDEIFPASDSAAPSDG